MGSNDANLHRSVPTMRTSPTLRLAALSFPGSGQVSLHRKLVLEDSFTIEFWLRLTSDDGRQGILGVEETPGEADTFFWVGDGKVGATVPVKGEGSTEIAAPDRLPLYTWVHVGLVSDGGQLRLFVNGEKEAVAEAMGEPSLALTTFGGTSQGLRGNLAEVRIWSVGRSDEELRAKMVTKLEGTEHGLEACWPMSESHGSFVYDMGNAQKKLGGVGYRGEVHDTSWAFDVARPPIVSTRHLDPHLSTVELGQQDITLISGWAHREQNVIPDGPDLCLEHAQYMDWAATSTNEEHGFTFSRPVVDFDGVRDVARVDGELDLSVEEWTIELWIYAALPEPGVEAVLLHHGDERDGFSLVVCHDGELRLIRRVDGISEVRSYPREFRVRESTWEHYSISCDSNGDVSAVRDGSSQEPQLGKWGTSLSTGKGALFVGGSPGMANNFQGRMSELRLWRRSWPKEHAQYNFDHRFGRVDPNSEGLLAAWCLAPGMRRRSTCWFATPSGQKIEEASSPIRVLTAPMADAELADVPLQAVVRNEVLYVFRQTTDHRLLLDQYQWAEAQDVLSSVAPTQILTLNHSLYRGWFAVDHDGHDWYVVSTGHNKAWSEYGDRITLTRFVEDARGTFGPATELGTSRLTLDSVDLKFVAAPAMSITGSSEDRRLVAFVPTGADFRTLLLECRLRPDLALPEELPAAIVGPHHLETMDLAGHPVDAGSFGPSHVRGALLNFLRTFNSVGLRKEVDGGVSVYFRGNGEYLQIGGSFTDPTGKTAALDDDYYQSGTHARDLLSEGNFFLATYAHAFTGLVELASSAIESPDPPMGFTWLVPPSFKVTGMCDAIAVLDRTRVLEEARGSSAVASLLDSLESRVTHIVGLGTFDEGMFKPLLTVPIDAADLQKITDDVKGVAAKEIQSYLSKPTDSVSVQLEHRMPPADKADLYQLADVLVADRLAKTDYWKDKVKEDAVVRRYEQAVRNPAYLRRLARHHREIASTELKALGKRTRMFRSYGDVPKMIAGMLTSESFFGALKHMSEAKQEQTIRQELHKLAVLDPVLADATGSIIAAHNIYATAVDNPWSVLFGKGVSESLAKEALTHAVQQFVDRSRGQGGDWPTGLAGLSGSSGITSFVNRFFYPRLQREEEIIASSASGRPPGLGNAEVFRAQAEAQMGAELKLSKLDRNYTRAAGALSVIATAGSLYILFTLGKRGTHSPAEKGQVAVAAFSLVSLFPTYARGARSVAQFFGLTRSGIAMGERAAEESSAADVAVASENAAANVEASIASEAAEIGAAEGAEAVSTIAVVGSRVATFCKWMGPVAEAVAVGFSINKFVHTLQNKNADTERKWIDGLEMANAGVGLAAGVALLVGEAAFAGPAGIAVVGVMLVGGALIGVDACHAREEEKRREERIRRQMQEHYKWLSWSGQLLSRARVVVVVSRDLRSTGFAGDTLVRGEDLLKVGLAGSDTHYKVWDGIQFNPHSQDFSACVQARVRKPDAAWYGENESSRWLDLPSEWSTVIVPFGIADDVDLEDAFIVGVWMADNDVKMYLGHTPEGHPQWSARYKKEPIHTLGDGAAYKVFREFQITGKDGLVHGRNYLAFEVHNGGWAGGLRVEFLVS